VKLKDVTLAQVIRFETPNQSAADQKVWILDLVKGLQDRYKFMEIPRLVGDYDLQRGMTFLKGTYFGKFVIEKFQIYNNGILCEAKIATESVDEFLDDATRWATSELGLLTNYGGTTPYLSNIEIESELDIAENFGKFSSLGKTIANFVRSNGLTTPDYSVSEITLHSDTWLTGTPRAVAFTFGRRHGHAHADNLYFSSAPLKTKDHLKVLDELESILAKKN
jgi:hypothetical protein